MQDGQTGLHPDHAADQVGGGDPGLADEVEIAAGTEEDGGENQGGDAVGQGPAKAMANCPRPSLASSWLSGFA